MSTILEALKKAQKSRVDRRLEDEVVVALPVRPAGGRLLFVPLACGLMISAGAVLIWYAPWKRILGKGPQPVPAAAVNAVAPRESVDAAIPEISEPSIEPSVPEFEFSGVIWDNHQRIALINGVPVAEGDTIDGAEVLTVGMESVEVKLGDRNYIINLKR
jgi:hypothetical protein